MKTDKLTKILLGIIAIALWMLALNPWLQPMPVAAREDVSFQCTGTVKAEPQFDFSRGRYVWDPATARYAMELDCD